jgi:multifunctional methyltransferase subunit TRM112
MILLTQNLLTSPMAGAADQKPLAIEATEVEEKEREYNEDFLKRILDRLDWPAFVAAAKSVGNSRSMCPCLCEHLISCRTKHSRRDPALTST